MSKLTNELIKALSALTDWVHGLNGQLRDEIRDELNILDIVLSEAYKSFKRSLSLYASKTRQGLPGKPTSVV